MTEHFVITDESGTPQFDVRGNLGFTQRLSFCDQAGQELAQIRKEFMSTRHEIWVGDQAVAEVRHEGFFGERYQIDSSFGQLTANGNFGGWSYSISGNGGTMAAVSRQLAFGERFLVETADGNNDVFILAVVLAIDAIHDERRGDNHPGGGLGGLLGGNQRFAGGGLGGLLGGNFP